MPTSDGRLDARQPAPENDTKRTAGGGSLTVWVPQGDSDDTSDTSLGIRGHFTYKFKEWIAGIGTFDYVFVNEDGDTDITYYNISFGGRVIKSRPGQLEPYGELLIGYHVLDGGILYPLSQSMQLVAGLAYSTVEFDFGLVNVDVDALVLEVGAAFKF